MIDIENKKEIKEILLKTDKKIFVVGKNDNFYISDNKPENITEDPLLILPPFNFKNSFTSKFNTKFPYMAGAMAKGISSEAMIEELYKNGFLGVFGSAGLSNKKIIETAKRLKSKKINFGINLINIPGNQENELYLIKELMEEGVDIISAGAYIKITPGLVLFRVNGLKKDDSGKITSKNKLIAKLSRKEIASRFLSPPPKRIVNKLLEQGLITKDEADLSQLIPMASDIIAEADSGGHTDKRPAISLLPEILYLRNETEERYENIEICIGLGGGIGTPESAAAAFAMGADFVVTGSINQSCVESGTSDFVKKILSTVEQNDFELVPSADTFELGGKVQVVKKMTKFASRAKFLEKLYNENNSMEDLKEEDTNFLEEKIFKRKINEEWQSTVLFFRKRGIDIEEKELSGKQKMALLFKSYLGQSSWWAIKGEMEREEDFQIWSGPSMAAFNSWTRGTFLSSPLNRRVGIVAKNIMLGAAFISRVNLLKSSGINLNKDTYIFKPIEYPEKYI